MVWLEGLKEPASYRVSSNGCYRAAKKKYPNSTKKSLCCPHSETAVSRDWGFISLNFLNAQNNIQQNYCVQSHIDCKNRMAHIDVPAVAPSIEGQIQWTLKFVDNFDVQFSSEYVCYFLLLISLQFCLFFVPVCYDINWKPMKNLILIFNAENHTTCSEHIQHCLQRPLCCISQPKQ